MPKSSGGEYLNKGTEIWVGDLTSKNPVTRRAALYALGEIGPPARSAASKVRRLLRDEESFVRLWAASALAKIEPEKKRNSIGPLRRGLKDQAAFVRSLAASFLGLLGSECAGIRGVLPALEDCLTDADPSVREEAALAIKRIRHRQRG